MNFFCFYGVRLAYAFIIFCPVGKTVAETKSAWAAVWVILIGLAMAAGGAYIIYKYRIRVSMVPIYHIDLFVFLLSCQYDFGRFSSLGKQKWHLHLRECSSSSITRIYFDLQKLDLAIDYRD